MEVTVPCQDCLGIVLDCDICVGDSQPLSQRNATDSSRLWNSLKTCAILAFGGRFGRRSSHWWVAWRIVPSGIFACMPFGVSLRFVTGLSTVR